MNRFKKQTDRLSTFCMNNLALELKTNKDPKYHNSESLYDCNLKKNLPIKN